MTSYQVQAAVYPMGQIPGDWYRMVLSPDASYQPSGPHDDDGVTRLVPTPSELVKYPGP